MKLVRADEVAPQPWRNGGGGTRELLAWPAAQDWRVRISLADIDADGPFSAFAGVERWFAVVAGAGVELDFGDGAPRRLCRGDAPLRFDGAAAPRCRLLDGPSRDLNLMLRGARGGMLRTAGDTPWQAPAASCGLFTAAAGNWSCADGRGAALPASTLLWFDDEAPAAAQSFSADPPAAAASTWWLYAELLDRAR